MKAEIIAVGSELLTPDRLDTNSLFLTEELNKLGIEVVRKTIVGDNRELLSEAFRDALNRVPLIIASGGLGPTEDDLTRETLAELLGRKLRRNDEILHFIEGRFRSMGREMPEVNVRQAMVPEGAGNPGESARHRAWIVARRRGALDRASARPAARIEAAVSGTGFAASASAEPPACECSIGRFASQAWENRSSSSASWAFINAFRR